MITIYRHTNNYDYYLFVDEFSDLVLNLYPINTIIGCDLNFHFNYLFSPQSDYGIYYILILMQHISYTTHIKDNVLML